VAAIARHHALRADAQRTEHPSIRRGRRRAPAIAQATLPDDLIYARTSDQPVQVRDSVNLFMRSLFEAVVLVVIIALVGFWEWRSPCSVALDS
jgi:Cu/Ag efflux pump CusA